MTKIRQDTKNKGLFWSTFDDGSERPTTENLAKGTQLYGEQIIRRQDKEFRVWDPYRSKLSAALLRGLQRFAFSPGVSVLYLGASTGTTASHISDIIGLNGLIFSVEFAPRVMRDLIQASTSRPNMIPIVADARHPESYLQIPFLVDVLYQDVAQPNQAEILIANARSYLKAGGTAYVALKARSIDVVAKPKRIFKREEEKMVQAGFSIKERLTLEPYTADHIFISAKFGEDSL